MATKVCVHACVLVDGDQCFSLLASKSRSISAGGMTFSMLLGSGSFVVKISGMQPQVIQLLCDYIMPP
jgi:hypothetical protein